jgi:hypothetical protein
MSSFDPPSGAEDLAAQAELIEAERAQMEADHKAMLLQRQQRKVEQGRADLERRRAELQAELAALDGEPLVVEPAGDVVVVDAEPADTTESEPDYTDAAVWDIDPDTGEAYRDEDGKPVPRWPYETIEFKGRPVQTRIPKPAALQVFGLINSRHTPAKAKNDAVAQFLVQYLSARSHAEIMAAMMDPDQDYEESDLSRLVEQIAKQGTARPTAPSRA